MTDSPHQPVLPPVIQEIQELKAKLQGARDQVARAPSESLERLKDVSRGFGLLTPHDAQFILNYVHRLESTLT